MNVIIRNKWQFCGSSPSPQSHPCLFFFSKLKQANITALQSLVRTAVL